MSARTRVFAGIVAIFVAGMAFLLYRAAADIDPRYRESAEESLVETSHLLAALIERDLRDGAIDVDRLRGLFRKLYARRADAQIFGVRKTAVELRAIVVDRRGTVLFDSTGANEGRDFSVWRDVRLTLAGQYGARTTNDIASDASTAVMWVAAPVRARDEIVGAVSVGKPTRGFGQFAEHARRNLLAVGAAAAAAVVALAVVGSVWLVRPFGLVSDWVRYARAQRRLSLPRLGRRAVDLLRASFDEMRDALAGRSHAKEYVETLVHELKSPLSAIRGAAELMREPMPEPDRHRFLGHVLAETRRIQELVDRMLELAALEHARGLARTELVDLAALAADVAAAAQARAARRGVQVACVEPGTDRALVEGDGLLLRRALVNLVDNAVDFSPDGGRVQLATVRSGAMAGISVRDHGCGIPDYALDRVFGRFYSLARPHSGKRGTGLGLTFVREIAQLHRGRIELANAPDSGVEAVLWLPCRTPRSTRPGR